MIHTHILRQVPGKAKNLFCILFLCFPARQVFAQFTLSGELRPRAELRHGYKSLADTDQDPAFFISQRSRLNLDYLNEKFRIGVSLQDVRTWGGTPQLNTSDDFLALHQAWGEILFTEKIRVKVGRQELVYDDQRIFGNVGWAQQGRSHDLALFRFNETGTTRLHIGLAFNQETEQLNTTYYDLNNYKAMQFLWFRNEWEQFKFSLLFLNSGYQYEINFRTFTTKYSQTFGTHINSGIRGYMLNGSAYLQTGKDDENKKLFAYLLGLEVSHTFGSVITPALGFEIQSGTDQEDMDGTNNHSFTPLYGTNHKFNGHMDYFYVGNHNNSVGLRDLYLRADLRMDRFSTMLAIHQFSTAARVQDPVDLSGMKHYLGIEIDCATGFSITDNVSLNLGYSHMFGSETMEVLKGGDKSALSNWAWMMITFKPVFLNPQK